MLISIIGEFYSITVIFSLKPVLIIAQSEENINNATFSNEVMENSPLYFSKSPQNL